MIQTEKYPAEKHNLQTKDGYILSIYRIPNFNQSRMNKKVILLMHGTIYSMNYSNIKFFLECFFRF